MWEPPAGRSATPRLPPGKKWVPWELVPLLPGQEMQWPQPRESCTWNSVLCTLNNAAQDWARQKTRLKVDPKPLFFWSISASALLLAQLLTSATSHTCHGCSQPRALPVLCILQTPSSPHPWKVQQLPNPWANTKPLEALRHHHAAPPVSAQRIAEGREAEASSNFLQLWARSWGLSA